MPSGDAARFFPLTSKPRRTQTGEPAHSVHAGGSVPARLGNTLIHINLTVSPLEPWHTEARVAVPVDSAYCPVLARVWGAQVRSLRHPVSGCTYKQSTFTFFQPSCLKKMQYATSHIDCFSLGAESIHIVCYD